MASPPTTSPRATAAAREPAKIAVGPYDDMNPAVLRVRRDGSPREMREPFHEHRGSCEASWQLSQNWLVCSCTTRATLAPGSSEASLVLVLQAHSELEPRGAPASLQKLLRTAATFAGFADPATHG